MKMHIYIDVDRRSHAESVKYYGCVMKSEAGGRMIAGHGTITWHRATLAILRAALMRLKEASEVHIYSNDAFVLQNLVNGSLERWEAGNFVKENGEHIKNEDLWREVYQGTRGHKIVPHVGTHEYMKALQMKFKEMKEGK